MDRVLRTIDGQEMPNLNNLKRNDKILEQEVIGQRIREVYDVNGYDVYIWSFNKLSRQSVYNPYLVEALGITEEALLHRIMKDWDPFLFIRKKYTLLRIEVIQRI
jgi:hypothetical protein